MRNSHVSNYVQAHFRVIILFLIICFYIINGIVYLRAQSLTSDEGSFYTYAVRFLKRHPDRTNPGDDNSKTPVSVLNTFPRIVEQLISPSLKKSNYGVDDIVHGRYITLFLSVITILLVFQWSKELYGEKAGLFSAFLFSICPNNLANAALVTTDAYSVLFLLMTMYSLWKYCRTGGLKYFLLFTVSAALSQLVKQSLFHLYILIPLCLFVYYTVYAAPKSYKLLLKRLLLFILVNWFIINLGYYFYKGNLRLSDYHFMSSLFQRMQGFLPGWLPVPFPKPFVDGLDMAKYYDQLGGGFTGKSSFGKVTILGRSSTGGSFWYYYFVSILFKTPISYFIFTLAGWIVLLKSKNRKGFWKREFFLFAPVVYFLVLMSFFYKTQCGIRHIIFTFPFLFIFSGIIVPHIKTAWQKVLFSVAIVYLLVSVLSYWKNYYPYTNEFITDKKMAYDYVGAGNLVFLQGDNFLKEYLNEHPDVHAAPYQPYKGTFVISIEDYLDIWNRHQYDWVKNYKPIGHVAHSYLLIKVE